MVPLRYRYCTKAGKHNVKGLDLMPTTPTLAGDHRQSRSTNTASICAMLLFVRPADERLRCDKVFRAANHFQVAHRHYAHRHYGIRVGERG